MHILEHRVNNLIVVRGSRHESTVTGPISVDEFSFFSEQLVRVSTEIVSLSLKSRLYLKIFITITMKKVKLPEEDWPAKWPICSRRKTPEPS